MKSLSRESSPRHGTGVKLLGVEVLASFIFTLLIFPIHKHDRSLQLSLTLCL